MAFVETVPPEDADGLVRREYERAARRAGRVSNVLRVMSLDGPTLKASMDLYQAVVLAPSPLGRVRREMLAVAVSQVNRCHY